MSQIPNMSTVTDTVPHLSLYAFIDLLVCLRHLRPTLNTALLSLFSATFCYILLHSLQQKAAPASDFFTVYLPGC